MACIEWANTEYRQKCLNASCELLSGIPQEPIIYSSNISILRVENCNYLGIVFDYVIN